MANVNAEKRPEIIMCSQLQPWSAAGVLPCMKQVADPSIPTKVGEQLYKTPRPHPWRPTLGYEHIEATPLPAMPITNLLVDARRIPYGMKTEPLKFPNLITGFDRNPLHAARAALYTRYTPCEWSQNQIRLYNEANDNERYSETLRTDAVCLIKEIDGKVHEGQKETSRSCGERITDIKVWHNELVLELEKLTVEKDQVQECRRVLQAVIRSFEGQLHIAQECLYHRESRKGIDLVHDEVEQALLKEIETIKNCQETSEGLMKKCVDQLTNIRAMQHQLQVNVQDKEVALAIDTVCHQMNNFSRGLQHYAGIEKYDRSLIETECWVEATNRDIKRSQVERAKSCRLRDDTESALKTIGHELLEAWEGTAKALERRIFEMLEAKGKLQIHLHKIQQEIFSIEKNMELLQKTIADKSVTLKVAHTRLEARTHRPEAELCKDRAQLRLLNEVKDINKAMHDMYLKLQQLEEQHQQLLRTRCNLESDLKSKMDSLFIDREKCVGLRRSYPISSNVKF